MKAYKLTDQQGRTYGGTQWEQGITHIITEPGNAMCTKQVYHCYRDPLMAVVMNPAHANIRNPLLWESDITDPVADDGLKLGTKQCTTLRQIPLPEITIEQQVRWAILCAMQVYAKPAWTGWAHKWLTGEDRSAASANASADAVIPDDVRRADIAASASIAAAAYADGAYAAADIAASASVAYAAASAAYVNMRIDFVALLHRAIKDEEDTQSKEPDFRDAVCEAALKLIEGGDL